MPCPAWCHFFPLLPSESWDAVRGGSGICSAMVNGVSPILFFFGLRRVNPSCPCGRQHLRVTGTPYTALVAPGAAVQAPHLPTPVLGCVALEAACWDGEFRLRFLISHKSTGFSPNYIYFMLPSR